MSAYAEASGDVLHHEYEADATLQYPGGGTEPVTIRFHSPHANLSTRELKDENNTHHRNLKKACLEYLSGVGSFLMVVDRLEKTGPRWVKRAHAAACRIIRVMPRRF